MTTYVATGRDPKANKAFWEAATLLLILLLVLLVSLCGLRGWLKSPIRRSVADPVDSRVRRDRRPDPVVQQRDGSAGEDVPEYEEPPSDGRETDYETGWGNGRGRSDDDTDDETRKPDVRIRYPDYNVDVKNLPQEGGWGLHLDQERSGSQQGRQRALRPTHGAAPYDADLFGDYEQSASPQKGAFDLETQPLRAIEEQGTMPNFDELNLRRSSEVREEVFSPVLLRTETTSPSKPPVLNPLWFEDPVPNPGAVSPRKGSPIGIGRPTSLADSIKQKSEFKPKTDQKAERRVPIPSEVEVPRGGKRKAAIAIGGESEGEEQALVTGEKRRKRYSIDLEPEKPRVKEREKGKFTAKGEQEVEDMILGEERRKRISLQKELAKAKGETKAKVKAALEAGQPIEDVITPEKKKAKVIEEASPKAARMRLTEEEVEPERLAKKAKDKARMTALKEVEDEEVEPERVARKAKDKVKMKTLKEEGDDEIEGLVRGKTKKTMGIDEEPAKATAKGAGKADIEELDDRIQRLETQTKRAETQKDKKRIEVDGDEEVLRGGRKSKKALDSGVDDRLPGDPRKSDKALDAGIDDRLPTSKRNRRARLNDSIDDDYDMRGQMSGGGGMGGFNTPAQAKMLRRQGKQQQLGMMDQQPMQDSYEDYAYPLANQRQQQTLGRSDHKRGATAQLRRQDLQLDGETSDEDPTAPFNPRKKDTKTTGEPGGKERRDKLKGKKKNAAAIGDHGSEDDGNSDGDPKQVRNPDQKKGMAKKGVDAAAPKNEKSDGEADSDDNGLDSDLETLLREEKGNFLSSPLKPVEPASVSRATGETTAEDVAVADLMLDSSERPARSPQTGSKPSGQGDRDESGRPPHHDALSNMSASEENDEQPRHERTEQSAEQSAASPAKVRKPRGVYTNERDEGMLRPSSDCDSEEEYPVGEDGESLETQDDERKRLARLGRKKKNETRQSGAYIPVKPRTNRWESDTYFNKEKGKEMYRPFDGCPSDQEQPLYSEDDNAYDKEKRLAWRVQSLHDETDEEDLRKSRRKSPTPAARKDERAVPGFRDETKHPSQRLPEQSTRRENKQLGENSGDTSSASVKPASGVPASGASLRDGVTTETPDEDGDEFRGRRRRLSSDEEEHVDATSDDDGDKTCTRRRRLSSDTENVDERSDYDGDKMYRPPRWSWGDAEEDADSQDETMEDYGERLHRQDERSEKERRAGEDQTARRENSPSSKDQKTPPSGGENILSSDDMRPDDNKLGGRDRSAVTKDQHGERQANDSRAPSKAGRKETKKSARQDGAWPEDDLDLGGRPVSFDFAQDDEGKTRPIDEARSASQRKQKGADPLSEAEFAKYNVAADKARDLVKEMPDVPRQDMTENDYEKMKEQTRVLLESIEVPPELQRGNRPDPASDVGTSESTGAAANDPLGADSRRDRRTVEETAKSRSDTENIPGGAEDKDRNSVSESKDSAARDIADSAMPTDSKDKTENEEYSDSDAGRPVDSEDRVQPPKPPMTEREKRRESGIPDTMMSGQGLPKAGGTPAGNAIPQYRHDRRRKEDEAPPPRRSAKENTGSQKQQVYENNTRYKAGFFHADGQNILNPITFVSSTFHVVTKAPFSSLAFLATLAIYTLGCRELGELVVFSSNDRSNAKRDLSANQKIFANLFAKSWLSPTGVFVLLNLWMFVGIVPVTLLLSFAITRADTPRKANANAWWRNPARSTRGVLSGIKSGLAGMVRVIAMDARLCGPRKFLRKSTWWTGLRIVLFLAQLVLTILLTRQALSLAYMVSTGSDKPFDTGPDTSSDTPALAAVAKSLTPVRMFAMLNFLLLFVITTLTVSWYALLHPRRPSTSTRRTGHSPGMILGIKTIGAIIIAIAFVSILFLFSDIASYTKNSLSAFTGANLVFGLFIPAMAWALLVFAEVLVKAWRTSGCKARPPQGSGDEAKASRSVSKKTKQ